MFLLQFQQQHPLKKLHKQTQKHQHWLPFPLLKPQHPPELWFLVFTLQQLILKIHPQQNIQCWFPLVLVSFSLDSSVCAGLHTSGPAEIYSLITFVPDTSQPISVGLEHPESHQDSTTDPTATYSFIMSENSIYQPSEVLVNTQPKEGNTEENENVYHLYCTIPDKPVHSNAGDQVYSLVKMH
ncbi:unnamed protein product [Leuciscus chuanchicus]